ncbi:MAG: hypothetical protein HY088_09855 [Ignavibacteriales bacterium]|nr:hypothetical protein [Ignavibacteriales bacterium]
MAKNKKTVYKAVSPKGMTVKDASEFWDDKTFFDFDDVKEVKFDVKIKGERHYVRLDDDIAKKIQSFSRKKHVSEQYVVNVLLKKSLEKVA